MFNNQKFATMATNKKAIWSTIWEILKTILTLGLSHIKNREDKE